MKKVYFAVYDMKAKAYGGPFLEVTEGTAIRAIQDAIKSPDHLFARHPGDFALHRLGSFDDETGLIEGHDPKPLIELEQLIGE